MRIDILTVVPELLASPLNESILKRAQEKGLVEIHIHNIRDYTEDKHRTTDDYPFGGEAGMVMKIEPIYRCIETLKAEREYDEVIYTSPDGIRYDQHEANRLSTLRNLIILCGHYKGIDHRIREHLVTREISIGDYVLTGGEFRMTAEGTTWHGGEILGKPRDRDDARRMLKILSGAHHLVTTGVTLRSAARMTHFTSLTYVWFRTLTDEEIAYYVDTFQPFDKAGAYGIQEWIGYAAIERIEGSFYNVMGLPVQKVYTELDKFLNP